MVKMAEPPKREADTGDEADTQPKRRRIGTDEAEEPSGSGDVSTLVEELPKEIADALDELDMCQREIDQSNEKASEEILKVEQKYNGLRKPMYAKRTEIISKIPQFWLTAFSNHPQLSTMIDEEEEKCLQYLRDVVVEENDDIKSGYKIRFLFDANPFFENSELMKDVHLPYGSETDVSAADDRPYIVCTEIKWKPGMNLLSMKNKKLKKRSRYDQPSSFLEWVTNDGESIGDEIAEVLKDDIWPNPMQYYLAPDIEENGMDDDDDDDDDVEEEESEDQEDGVVVVEEEEDDEVQGVEDEDDVEEEGAEDPNDDLVEEDEEP